MHLTYKKHIPVTVSTALLLVILLLAGTRLRAQNGSLPTHEQYHAGDTLVDETVVAPVADTSTVTDAPPDVSNGVSQEEDGYTREEKLRRYQHPLYDTISPDENAQKDLDYTTMWERKLPDNAASELRKKKEFTYEEKVQPPSAFTLFLASHRGMLVKLLWFFLIVMLASALLFLLLSNSLGFNLFSRGKKGVNMPMADALEDPRTTDYQQLLQQAMTSRNWTAGVRYLYLYTLQQMQQKGMIQVGPDKTNRDYLRDLTNTRWHKHFTILTLDYEYICYGNFEISEQQFEVIRQQFTAFKNELG